MRLGPLIALQTCATVLASVSFGALIFNSHKLAMEEMHRHEELEVNSERFKRVGALVSQLTILGDLTFSGSTTYLSEFVKADAQYAVDTLEDEIPPAFLVACGIDGEWLTSRINRLSSLIIAGSSYGESDREQTLMELLGAFDGTAIELTSAFQDAQPLIDGELQRAKFAAKAMDANAKRAYLVGGSLTLLVILAMWRFLVRKIQAPIVHLTASTQEAASTGQFEYMREGPEEVQTLSQRFESLVRGLQEAVEARSAFVANTSHELRTPLNAILGYAEFLQKDQVSEEDLQEGLSSIQSSGAHLLDLIQAILDLSKIDADQMVLDPGTTDMPSLFHDVHAMLCRTAASRGSKLELDLDGTLPSHLLLDAMRLRQVLLNVVGNAIKFTEDGTVRIEAQYERDVLRVTIKDSGIGIPHDRLEAIFEAFEQADSSSTRLYGGTGLGLPISRRLARLMGGDLSATSTIGVGSQFHLTVDAPTASEAIAAPIAADRASDAASPAEIEHRALSILVVDDVAMNCRLASKLLERDGHRVETRADGQEAVDMILAALDGGTPPDVILMDLQMPVLSGSEATRQILEAGYRGPVVALTAAVLANQRQEAIDAGCCAFVAKPFRAQDLLDSIQREYARYTAANAKSA